MKSFFVNYELTVAFSGAFAYENDTSTQQAVKKEQYQVA